MHKSILKYITVYKVTFPSKEREKHGHCPRPSPSLLQIHMLCVLNILIYFLGHVITSSFVLEISCRQTYVKALPLK